MSEFNLSVVEGTIQKAPCMIMYGQACKFEITCKHTKDNGYGEKIERETAFEIIAHKKLGEVCHKYLKEGARVLIQGRLESVQEKLRIEAKEVNFLTK